MITLLLIVWLHWIADFILQSDYTAKNKSKSNLVLLNHVAIYAIPFFIASVFWSFSPVWIILNAALHFVIDWCTSRVTSKLWAKQQVHNFFVVIGLDQALHLTCLLVTYYFMDPFIYGWF